SVPLLLYGGLLPSRQAAAFVVAHDLISTIVDIETARNWSTAATEPIRAFLKLDVGLERLGTPPEDAVQFARAARELANIEVEGVYTHLHGSTDKHYLAWQLERFARALGDLETAGVHLRTKLAESSVTFTGRHHPCLNAVDPGHLLYGLLPVGRLSSL